MSSVNRSFITAHVHELKQLFRNPLIITAMAVIEQSTTLFAVALLGLFAIKESMGTSCDVQHPQTAVCRASFVIKGKILDIDWQPGNQKGQVLQSLFKPRYIKVELRRLFKGVNSIKDMKFSTVYIRFASLDRPLLEVGQVYVLSGYSFGKSLFMNPCSWSSKWSELTTGQRFGVARQFYWIYCGCKIVDCQSNSCPNGIRSCNWNRQNSQLADFLIKDGICMVTDGASCKWKNFSL